MAYYYYYYYYYGGNIWRNGISGNVSNDINVDNVIS